MNRLINSVKDNDQTPFISVCKHQGIIPEQMAQHLSRLLKTAEDPKLEKLHLALCSQLKAERIQNIAERYRYNCQTFAQLEANCLDFSLDIRDVAEYFVQHCDDERGRQLRDAVLMRRDCPGC